MYTFTSKVRFSETDESGNLSLSALLDYLQDCCLFQADSLGIGPEYLRQRHKLWVLSGWQVVVYRYPRMFEKIVIGTKVYEFKGCFCISVSSKCFDRSQVALGSYLFISQR